MPTITGTNNSETLIGTAEADSIEALGGNDIIDGGLGADTMDGGTGDDIFIVENAGDLVVEDPGEGEDEVRSSLSYTLVANVENLTLTGAAAINGTGNSLNNRIIGNDAANIISGGGGSDIFIGGGGDDQYFVDGNVVVNSDGSMFFSQVDQVVEEVGGGNDFVTSNVSYTLGANVEHLILTGSLDLSGTGNELSNTIVGNAGSNFLRGLDGDDYLDGGAGNDFFIGGNGNDTYVIDSAGDTIQPESPSAEGGTDTVISSISYTLDVGLENLTLGGTAAINGVGTGFANVMIGNIAANVLNGGGGDDIISGFGGNDTLLGDFGADTITGGAGFDTLTGGAGGDTFIDTAAGLAGDTITDLGAGDRIVISDASLSTFAYSVSGNTLTYSGGSLTISNAANVRLFATAAAGGGVQLDIVTNDAAYDFNGDGRSDILWRTSTGQLDEWLANLSGNGGFTANVAASFPSVSTSWQVVGIGDFDGDGRDDLVWRNSNGQLSNWLANDNANGGFAPNDANALTSVPTSWVVAGVGDFNGDGKDDLLWRNTATGQLSDWLANADGSGGFTQNDANALRSVPSSWVVAGVGDFNGDGKDDILWRNTTTGQLSDWLANANGNGGFTQNDSVALTTVSVSWQVAGVGDVNGDNRDDIIWRSTSGQLSTWLATPMGGFSQNDANALTTVASEWHIVAVGDYNGDNRDDILWRNSATGDVSNWLGTQAGGFVLNDANAFGTAPLDWTVQAPDTLYI